MSIGRRDPTRGMQVERRELTSEGGGRVQRMEGVFKVSKSGTGTAYNVARGETLGPQGKRKTRQNESRKVEEKLRKLT